MKDSSTRDRQHLFQFKQFQIDQRDCAMRINTDGVLLGAMAGGNEVNSAPTAILDIGTGTGVIALMLAQSFPDANVDAIEIDEAAAARAGENFKNSPFSTRLKVHCIAMEKYEPGRQYDLIVSNPPYFLDALKNPDKRKELARHADRDFFSQLIDRASLWLKPGGSLQLILPPDVSDFVETLSSSSGLRPTSKTIVYSFKSDNQPIRILLTLSKAEIQNIPSQLIRTSLVNNFVIYSERGIYTQAYQRLLSEFFLAF